MTQEPSNASLDPWPGDAHRENPYSTNSLNTASPYAYPASEGLANAPAFPTAVRVIGIIFLVFGIMGVPLGIFSVGQAIIYQFVPSDAGDPQTVGIIQAMKEALFIHLTNGILNVLLSISMIVAAVGLVWRKRWGAQLGGVVAIMAIFYKLIETIGGGYAQWKMIEKMQAGVLAQAPQGFSPDTMRWMMIVGIVIGLVIFSTPLVVFYGWAAYYLRRPSTLAHFASPTPLEQPSNYAKS